MTWHSCSAPLDLTEAQSQASSLCALSKVTKTTKRLKIHIASLPEMTPEQLLRLLDRLHAENLHGPTSTMPRNSRASSTRNSLDRDFYQVSTGDMDAGDPRYHDSTHTISDGSASFKKRLLTRRRMTRMMIYSFLCRTRLRLHNQTFSLSRERLRVLDYPPLILLSASTGNKPFS